MTSSHSAAARSVAATSIADHKPHGMERLADTRLYRPFAFIGGRWRSAASGALVEVTNPANGEVIGHVPGMGREEAREAVEAAEAAFGPWRALLPQERARLLRAWHEEILGPCRGPRGADDLEQGKPLAESRGEIAYGASFVEWFAEEARRIDGEMPMSHLPGRMMTVRREPVGVVACITPWNFPSAMITRKAAAALAAGCIGGGTPGLGDAVLGARPGRAGRARRVAGRGLQSR